MPSPATTDEFLDLVQKSAVVDDKRLSAYVDTLRAGSSWPAEVRQAAALLVRDGILTNFQAEQLLQGKWKRFTIGKYKVLERLGAGGMGSVYLCEHKLMRRRVAVKVLPTAKADDPSSLERFYREARAVAALDHPNIVRAYDIDQDEKLHFLVMEHVDGASLQEIIKRSGQMEVLRACHYMRQAALGLQHAHDAAGLIHRDIKPGNILVDRNGIVKILDMGLARFFYDEEDMLTKKYDENVLGTADYLAPEQATDSHAVDIRADIYSLGATFYFCLTGRTPFQEGTIAQKLIWHQTRLPKPIRSFRPEVPDGVIAVIDKAMSKDASARYQSPLEMAEALKEWTTTPIPPPPEIEMPKLSPAAQAPGSENNFTGSTRPSPGPLSPSPRKTWQVPTPTPAPIAQAVAKTVAPLIARPAPTLIAAVPSARPVTATAPAPKPAVNGLFRQPAVAKPLPVGDADATTREQQQHTAEMPASPARLQRLPNVLNALAKRPWVIVLFFALAGVVLLAGVVAVVAYSWSSAPASTTVVKPQRKPLTYPMLNAAGEPMTFEAVLLKATVGDHLILNDDVTASELNITTKDLTIEGAPGKKIVWHYPEKAPADGKLLSINSAAGLTLKDFTLDGGKRAKTLVNLFGHAPNLCLKNLQFANFKKYAVNVTSCEGTEKQPIELSELVFKTTAADQVGLYFDLLPNSGQISADRHYYIHDCKSEGPGKLALASQTGKVADLDARSQPELLKLVSK